eukprot:TRINITY_DN10130_c0_g1_i1.p1 TRINITY_DN10130_c0_g1~~TRINITY_DN10130_c0_g1_i1.p1  ORF type:complete len:298 (-),score=56.01 TRINITY_DN10130_c0_g1_i1:64-957(-)
MSQSQSEYGTGISATGTMVDESQNDLFVLDAIVENAKILSQVLSTLNGPKVDHVNIEVAEDGIHFMVDVSQCFQGRTCITKDLFSRFIFSGDRCERFSVVLDVLLDCLNIYGTAATPGLKIMYKGYETPLFLIISDDDVITDCGIRAMEFRNILPIDIGKSDLLAKVIINSESLQEAFNELDWTNDSLTFILCNDDPCFRLISTGTGASCQVDIPRESEMFETFQCQEYFKREYKMKLLHPCLKALKLASKTQIQVNRDGILQFEHIIPTEDKLKCSFVNFSIVPNEEDSDEGGYFH